MDLSTMHYLYVQLYYLTVLSDSEGGSLIVGENTYEILPNQPKKVTM